MNKILEADLLKSAVKIGEEIIDKAIIDSSGIHWKTVKSVTVMGNLEMEVDETIATGTSGIVLFYIDLYKNTKDEIYLKQINSSANWLINYCQKKPATHGFYTGRMGTVYTLLKIAEITQKEHYHAKAAEIALQFKDILSIPIQNCNLYNGLAGSILGLLYLHAEIKETWILDSIYKGVEYLITKVNLNGTGFYWDNGFAESRNISTKPLCSMPFGSSGIALLFLYLSTYFKNKDYEYIGLQTLKYEDQYYNSNLNNWPDFRINADYQALRILRKSYFKGDCSHFESKNYSADWKHGLVGLNFTRLRAYDIVNDKYSTSIVNTIKNNLNENIGYQLSNYTLSTGKGGLGLLLLEQSHHTKNERLFDIALNIAKNGIDERATKGFYQFGFNVETEYEDDSLLMGNAGIGYFYLKLLNKDNDCVLLPTLNGNSTVNSDHKVYHFTINNAVNTIMRARYPNTFSVIKYGFDTSKLNVESLKHSLRGQLGQTVKALQDMQIDDAYKYDKFKLNIQDVISDNSGHFRFCHTTEVAKNANLLETTTREGLMEKTLTLNPYTYFLTCKWDWKNASSKDVQSNAEEIYTLHSLGEEFTLSEHQYIILSCFKIPRRLNNVYKIFLQKNESSGMDRDYLFHSFTNTIRFFMSKGVLTQVKYSVLRNLIYKPKGLNEDVKMAVW